MDDDYGDEGGPMVFDSAKLKSGKRDHEIYEGTYYIPNDKLRLLEVPMNSSLRFQMILYYHWYFDFLYGALLCTSGVYKLMIANNAADPLSIVSLLMTIMFLITESFRLKFGYSGNINESYPDLIAFTIQTVLFSIPFTIVPAIAPFKFPHEMSLYIINVAFILSEVVVAGTTMSTFQDTGMGSFYRRAAPLIDPKFKKKYEVAEESGSNREIQIGL